MQVVKMSSVNCSLAVRHELLHITLYAELLAL